jgi:hypothetical protein
LTLDSIEIQFGLQREEPSSDTANTKELDMRVADSSNFKQVERPANLLHETLNLRSPEKIVLLRMPDKSKSPLAIPP